MPGEMGTFQTLTDHGNFAEDAISELSVAEVASTATSAIAGVPRSAASSSTGGSVATGTEHLPHTDVGPIPAVNTSDFRAMVAGLSLRAKQAGAIMHCGAPLALDYLREHAAEHPESDVARDLVTVLLIGRKFYEEQPFTLKDFRRDYLAVFEQMRRLHAGLQVAPIKGEFFSLIGEDRHVVRPEDMHAMLQRLEAYHEWTGRRSRINAREARRIDQAVRAGVLPTPPEDLQGAHREEWMRQASTQYKVRGQLIAAEQQASAMQLLAERITESNREMQAQMLAALEGRSPRDHGTSEPVEMAGRTGAAGQRWAKYTGPQFPHGVELLTWIRLYERLCTTENYDDDVSRIAWLNRTFDPKDSRVWKWYGRATRTTYTWDGMKKNIVGTFVPEADRKPFTYWTNEIASISKEKGETIREFEQRFTEKIEDLDLLNRYAESKFVPSEQEKRMAWFTALDDKEMTMLEMATRTSTDYALEDVISETITRWEARAAFRRPAGRKILPAETQTRASAARSVPRTQEPSASEQRPTQPGAPRPRRSDIPARNAPATGSPRSMLPRRPHATATAPPSPVAASSNVASGTSRNVRNRPADKDADMATLTEKMKQLRINLGGEAQPFNTRSGSFTCYRCGETGHMSRDCQSETTLDTWRGYRLYAELQQHEYAPDQEEAYLQVYRLAQEEGAEVTPDPEDDAEEESSEAEDFQQE